MIRTTSKWLCWVGLLFPAVGAAAPAAVFSPQEAVRLAWSEPLSYVGKFAPDGTDFTEACVWKGANVWVVDFYCFYRRRGADPRSEISSAGIYVFSPEQGMVKLYAETKDDYVPLSSVGREKYNSDFWDIYFSPLSGDEKSLLRQGTTLAQFRRLFEANSDPDPSCSVVKKDSLCRGLRNLNESASSGGQPLPPECDDPGISWIARCRDFLGERRDQWAKEAGPFWDSPTQEWYGLLKKMVKLRAAVPPR